MVHGNIWCTRKYGRRGELLERYAISLMRRCSQSNDFFCNACGNNDNARFCLSSARRSRMIVGIRLGFATSPLAATRFRRNFVRRRHACAQRDPANRPENKRPAFRDRRWRTLENHLAMARESAAIFGPARKRPSQSVDSPDSARG